MPKMDRATFAAALDDMWALTQNRLITTGAAWTTLIVLDSMGRQRIFMDLDPETPGLKDANVTLTGGPFHENVDTLGEAFRSHRAVAAILYGEGWSVANETYAETVRLDLPVHEHPMKDELAFAVGLWPREFFARHHQALIVRDEQGRLVRLADEKQFDESGTTVFVSWLAELLPQPY